MLFELTLTQERSLELTDTRGRPHSNDHLRWHELYLIAGVIVYEHADLPRGDLLTVEEFMEDVERRLRRE